MWQLVSFLSMIFQISIQNVPEGPDCSVCKSNFCLTDRWIFFYTLDSTKFLTSPANSVQWFTQQNFGQLFSVNTFETVFRVSFEPLVFIHFAFLMLSSMSWRTSKYLTPLLSLAALSTNTKCKPPISFLNLANAFILRIFRSVWEYFVYMYSNAEIVELLKLEFA